MKGEDFCIAKTIAISRIPISEDELSHCDVCSGLDIL